MTFSLVLAISFCTVRTISSNSLSPVNSFPNIMYEYFDKSVLNEITDLLVEQDKKVIITAMATNKDAFFIIMIIKVLVLFL